MLTVFVALWAAADARWPPAWSWDTLPLSAFPGAVLHSDDGGLFNQSTVAFYSRFDVVGMMGLNASCRGPEEAVYTGGKCPIYCTGTDKNAFVPNMHDNLKAQAATLRRANNATSIYPYLYTTCNQLWYEYGAEFDGRPEFWLNDTMGKPVVCPYWQGSETHMHDMTNVAWRAWWMERAVGPYSTDADVDAIFFDEVLLWANDLGKYTGVKVTPEYQNAYRQGLIELVKEISMNLTGEGKLPWYSCILNRFSGPEADRQLYAEFVSVLTQRGGGIFREFFAGSLLEVQEIMYLASVNVPMQIHFGTGAGDKHDPDHLRFILGAYLIAAGKYHYFQYSTSWKWDSFPWLDEYSKRLGAPLGLATNTTASLFHRRFEHLDVSVDFAAQTATLDWTPLITHV